MAEYQELRVRFERIGEAGAAYRLFASGPAGEAVGEFRSPFADVEVENLVLKLSRPRSSVRRMNTSELALVRDFGSSLFDALFSGRVRDLYRSSLSSARNEGCGLRISLALTGAPELMPVPWEFLYDDPGFLSISTWTPVVRYLDLATTRRPLKVDSPLRILAMVSSPTDVVELDVAQERSRLERSLAPLLERGSVRITWLEQATMQGLQRELRRDDFHVFHYIGHGGYDAAMGDGVLVLEDETRRARHVSGMELGTILADETTLRLAVLNACEGARNSISDPFSGVATSLVRREIPAVVAMQLEITDRAAITFAGELYAALADGYAIDAALAEARKAIFADENEVEWATPVLFMRVPDGRIFDLAGSPAVREERPEVELPVAEAEVEPAPVPSVVAALPVPSVEPALAPGPSEGQPVPARRRRFARWTRPASPYVPVRLVVELAACTVALLLGVIYPWDNVTYGESWLDGGKFGGLSPLALVGVVAAATVFAARGRHLQLVAGLAIGAGAAALGKYLGLLVRPLVDRVAGDSAVNALVPVLVLGASFALIAIGIELARRTDTHVVRERMHDVAATNRATRVLLGVSALLILLGALAQTSDGWVGSYGYSLPVDAFVTVGALAVLAFGIAYLPPPLGAGVVLAVGVESFAFWLWLGSALGLAGATLALGVGIRLALAEPQDAASIATA